MPAVRGIGPIGVSGPYMVEVAVWSTPLAPWKTPVSVLGVEYVRPAAQGEGTEQCAHEGGLSVRGERDPVAFVEVGRDDLHRARGGVKPIHLVRQQRRRAESAQVSVPADMPAWLLPPPLPPEIRRGWHARDVSEEQLAGLGVDLNVVERVELAAEEVVEQDGCVARVQIGRAHV